MNNLLVCDSRHSVLATAALPQRSGDQPCSDQPRSDQQCSDHQTSHPTRHQRSGPQLTTPQPAAPLPSTRPYDPFGYRPAVTKVAPALGFNGQRAESGMERYHLGHGRRVYNPVLRRFHEADSLSPFAAGGLNAYAYCAGDPINYRDPSGASIEWLHDDAAMYVVPMVTLLLNGLGLVKGVLALSVKPLRDLTRLDRVLLIKPFVVAPLSVTTVATGLAAKSDETTAVGLALGAFSFGVSMARILSAMPDTSWTVFKANFRKLLGLSERGTVPRPIEMVGFASRRSADSRFAVGAALRDSRGSTSSRGSTAMSETRREVAASATRLRQGSDSATNSSAVRRT